MIRILRFLKDPSGARVGFIDCVSGIQPNNEKKAYLHNDIVLFDKNGKRWIKMPDSNKRTGIKNDKGYDILRPAGGFLDKEMQKDLGDAIIAALDAWLAAGNKPEIPIPKENTQHAAPTYGAGSNGAYDEGVPF